MNRIDGIDEKIKETLFSINGELTEDGHYTYHTTTNTVNVEDIALSMESNDNLTGTVDYLISKNPVETVLTQESSTNAIDNESYYIITARIYLDDADSTGARSKLNDIISDIKRAFFNNITLNKTCNWFLLKRIEPNIVEQNDILYGEAKFEFELNYSQDVQDPDKKYICY